MENFTKSEARMSCSLFEAKLHRCSRGLGPNIVLREEGRNSMQNIAISGGYRIAGTPKRYEQRSRA